MGISYYSFDMLDVMSDFFGGSFSGIRMMEFGCQQIRWKNLPEDSPWRKFESAKQFFNSKGVAEHVSIDLDGRFGSIKLDLSRPLKRPEWKGRFDCVTNFGTLEHVDVRGMEGQYEAFRTMHVCCRPGGLLVHLMPGKRFTPEHCRITYGPSFIRDLADMAGYEMIYSSEFEGKMGTLMKAIMVRKDSPFPSREDFERLELVIH